MEGGGGGRGWRQGVEAGGGGRGWRQGVEAGGGGRGCRDGDLPFKADVLVANMIE